MVGLTLELEALKEVKEVAGKTDERLERLLSERSRKGNARTELKGSST